MQIHSQWVQVHNGDLAIAAYLATPKEEGTWPAVVVIQEIFGVNEHIRDVTERIAQEGYVAIAPAIYQRQAPNFETGYTPEVIAEGRKYKEQTQTTELLSDIQATIDYLYTLPQVKKAGIRTIGFCFGGLVVYLAATLPAVKATASFYGAGIPHWAPGETEPTITKTPDIKGTIYAFFGLEDASIPVLDTEKIEAALTEAQIPHQIFRYPGADHGFFCDRRGSYHPEAAQDAWHKVLALFAQ
ncbi:MAG: dienelactone hydrolase family protein [Snowella sp.]|nr:dienelactone hydrolase family protein [Snowella sp.]